MTSESDSQAINSLDDLPIAFSIPGEQILCVLVQVLDTPKGLVAFPDPAVVAEDDVILWFAAPGLGAFNIGLEAVDGLEVKVAGNNDTKQPPRFAATGARKNASKGKETPAHVWHAGASHLVSARPKHRSATGLRYWLWKADGGTPGEAMTLFVTGPRRQVFGTSGTVRPENTP